MGAIDDEANRRWPDEPRDSQFKTNPRFSAYRRGFRLGAWWHARQPTDDVKLEQARRAGQVEALMAVEGYINLMWKQNQEHRSKKSPQFWDGFDWATGHLSHMAQEARGQIESEGAREVRMFKVAEDA